MVATTIRGADLPTLSDLLQRQNGAKVDVIAPATALTANAGGLITVAGTEPVLTDEGVTAADGHYAPTEVMQEGIGEKLGIPTGYLRRMHTERPHLWAANINEWLHGGVGAPQGLFDPDPRSFLFRGYRADGDSPGVARALLSDRYSIIDNFDVLIAALAGIKKAGTEVVVHNCDVSERNMYIRVSAPQVIAMAPILLSRYRSPFTDPEVDAQRIAAGATALNFGYGNVDRPIVFAGFEIRNSEVGGSAFTITPRLTVKVCNNGMTVQSDRLRNVHLGGKQEHGVIRWSEETQRKTLELVTAKAADAVTTFLDRDYLREQIALIEEKAGKRVSRPDEQVRSVAKSLSFDEVTAQGILDHFILGGSMTAGGVMNAVTSYAQVVPDADKAAKLEASALRALDLAAA